MKKILLTAVIMTIMFLSGCGEENPNALPDNGAGAMMPDGSADYVVPDSGVGSTTPDNSGIIGNVN